MQLFLFIFEDFVEREWIIVASVKLSFVASQFNHSRVVWVEAYFVDEMGELRRILFFKSGEMG